MLFKGSHLLCIFFLRAGVGIACNSDYVLLLGSGVEHYNLYRNFRRISKCLAYGSIVGKFISRFTDRADIKCTADTDIRQSHLKRTVTTTEYGVVSASLPYADIGKVDDFPVGSQGSPDDAFLYRILCMQAYKADN